MTPNREPNRPARFWVVKVRAGKANELKPPLPYVTSEAATQHLKFGEADEAHADLLG